MQVHEAVIDEERFTELELDEVRALLLPSEKTYARGDILCTIREGVAPEDEGRWLMVWQVTVTRPYVGTAYQLVHFIPVRLTITPG